MEYRQLKKWFDIVFINEATRRKIAELIGRMPLTTQPFFQQVLVNIEKDGKIIPVELRLTGENKYEIYLASHVQDETDKVELMLGGETIIAPKRDDERVLDGKTFKALESEEILYRLFIRDRTRMDLMEANQLYRDIVFFLEKAHFGLHLGQLKLVQKSFPNYGPSDRYQVRGQRDEAGNWVEPTIINKNKPHKSAVYQIK